VGSLNDKTFRFGRCEARVTVDIAIEPWCWDCDKAQTECRCDHEATLTQQLRASLAAKLAELETKRKG